MVSLENTNWPELGINSKTLRHDAPQCNYNKPTAIEKSCMCRTTIGIGYERSPGRVWVERSSHPADTILYGR